MTVSGGGGETSFEFWHNSQPNISISYMTYNIKDQIFVNGQLLVPCESTGTEWGGPVSFQTVGNSTIITVISCGSPSSKFKLKIRCGGLLRGDTPQEGIKTPSGNPGVVASDLLVKPNPFNSSMTVTLRNVQEPFEGQVLLLNNHGLQVASREISFEKGHNVFTFDELGALANGTYFIVVHKDGKPIIHQTVVKME